MRKLVLFVLLISLFAMVSCNEEPATVVQQTPTIRGSVSIPAGAGVTGSDFYVRIMEGERAVYTDKVNSDGSFSVSGLSEERTYSILLTTEEPGNINDSSRDVPRAATSGYGGWLSNVTASVNEQAGVGSIKVKPLGTIRGVVKKDGAEDNYDTTVYIPGTSYLAMTDGEGNFSIFNVPQATYTLRFISSGYMARMVDNVVLHSDSDTENPVTTVQAQTLIKNAGNLIGTISKTGSTDHSNVTVMLSDGKNTFTGSTSSDGSLLISSIIPGTYTATISASGFLTQTIEGLTIEAAKNTALNPISLIANGGSIAGTVEMNDGGEKAGVLITAKSTDDKYSYTTSTDAEGKYVINNTYPGVYILTASKAGYPSVTTGEAASIAGQTTTIGVISLSSKYGSVSGRVALSESVDNSGVTVSLTCGAGPSIAYTAVSGADGTYTISSLTTAGQYTITFSKDGYVSNTGTVVNVVLGQNQVIEDVTLKSLASKVFGNVTLEETGDYTGISVQLKAVDGSVQYDATTDQQGNYVMARVNPGEYSLTASKAGYVSKTVESIIIESSTEKELDLVILNIGTRSVFGTVSLELGNSHEGTLVTATNTQDTTKIYSAITNTAGEFTLAGMVPGRYNVALSHSNYVTSTVSIDVIDGTLATIDNVKLAIARGAIQGYAKLEGYTDYSGTSVVLVGTDYSTVTDNEGFYSLNVPTGNYSGGILFEHEDFESHMHVSTVTVQMSGAYGIPTVTLDAKNVRVVKGVFTLKDRSDSSGISVYFEDLPHYSAETDTEGNWVIEHVPLGQHNLVTYRENVKSFSMTVELEPAPAYDNGTLVLIPESATIQGFARLSGMTSYAGIEVTATPEGVGDVITTTTKADGSYYMSNLLSTSDYTISFFKEGWKMESIKQRNFTELEVRTLDDIAMVDNTAPVISDVVINNGGATTSDREIRIYLSSNDLGSGCKRVQINTENRFDETVIYRDYYDEQDFTLPEGNGEKTIYIKVYDLAGNGSEVFRKTITLTEQKTKVGGVLVGATDIVWTKEKSPYYVESSILVESGRTLTIEHGVVVEFAGPYYIDVEGTMYVNGTEDDMVCMYGVGEGENTWKGVNFLSKNLVYTGTEYEPVYVSGNRMSYVNIQNNAEGITGTAWIEKCTITTSSNINEKASWQWRGLAFGNAGFGEGPQSNGTQMQSIFYVSGVFKDNTIIGDFSCYGLAPFIFANNQVEGNVFIQNTNNDARNMEYHFYNNRFVGIGCKFGIDTYYKNDYFFANNAFNGFESLSVFSSWSTERVDWGDSRFSYDNCSFEAINQISIDVRGSGCAGRIKGVFCGCLFDSIETIEIGFSVDVNYSNIIDVSKISVTSQRQYLGSNSFSNNYWGPDKVFSMNNNGDDFNYAFFSDFYDDIVVSKLDYSGWVQNPFETAGYRGEDYCSYELVPEKPIEATINVDSDYVMTNVGVNRIFVLPVYGSDAIRYRAFQNLDELLVLASDEGWTETVDHKISIYPDNLKDWFIQIEDGNGRKSRVYRIAPIFLVGGPAGGFVFYDCDADNNSGDSDGLRSSEIGWRYLEAAPADLKVVNGVPTVDSSVNGYSSASSEYEFGYYRTADSGDNLYVNGTPTYRGSNCTGTAIGTGESNTQLLAEAMGDETYSSESGSNKTSNYAARLCDIVEYTVDGVTYDDWFLPSKDELNVMYTNLHMAGLGDFANYGYWSSSEDSDFTYNAWLENFYGSLYCNSRQLRYKVRPIRTF